jgi:hypothetical protein
LAEERFTKWGVSCVSERRREREAAKLHSHQGEWLGVAWPAAFLRTMGRGSGFRRSSRVTPVVAVTNADNVSSASSSSDEGAPAATSSHGNVEWKRTSRRLLDLEHPALRIGSDDARRSEPIPTLTDPHGRWRDTAATTACITHHPNAVGTTTSSGRAAVAINTGGEREGPASTATPATHGRSGAFWGKLFDDEERPSGASTTTDQVRCDAMRCELAINDISVPQSYLRSDRKANTSSHTVLCPVIDLASTFSFPLPCDRIHITALLTCFN